MAKGKVDSPTTLYIDHNDEYWIYKDKTTYTNSDGVQY